MFRVVPYKNLSVLEVVCLSGYYVYMKDDDISRAIRLCLFEEGHADQSLHDEVSKILSFVADVRSVDTDTDAVSSGAVNVFRDDVVTVSQGAFRDHMLDQAPSRFKDWFLSKKIL